MKDFAGRLAERVEILKRTPGRDALGAADQDWTVADQVWAEGRPVGTGAGSDYVADALGRAARWCMTMRPCDVRPGDRVDRALHMLDVLEVTPDPDLADRISVIGEVVR